MIVEDIVSVLDREIHFEVRESYYGSLIFDSEEWNDTSRYKSKSWDDTRVKAVEQVTVPNQYEVTILVKR